MRNYPLPETIHLMASILCRIRSLTVGNNYHITLVANDKVEADRVLQAFSWRKGNHAYRDAQWGPYSACVKKFRHPVDVRPRSSCLRRRSDRKARRVGPHHRSFLTTMSVPSAEGRDLALESAAC